MMQGHFTVLFSKYDIICVLKKQLRRLVSEENINHSIFLFPTNLGRLLYATEHTSYNYLEAK